MTNFMPISTPSSDPTLRMSSRLLSMAATLPLMRPRASSLIDVTIPLSPLDGIRMEDPPILDCIQEALFDVTQVHADLTHRLLGCRRTRAACLHLLSKSARVLRSNGQAHKATHGALGQARI